MHASCCEGQGTRLFGKLPELVFSLTPAPSAGSKLDVDLYTASSVSFGLGGGVTPGTLTVDTAWPYGTEVGATLSFPPGGAPITGFEVVLRIPAWVAAPAGGVVVEINGVEWPQRGTPGTYLHLSPTSWPAGSSSISLSLPMAWESIPYTGSSQLPPYTRAAFLYGPVLMAFEGGVWNATVDALVMPAGIDVAAPATWLSPSPDGNALHFVGQAAGVTAKPYWEVQDAGELFTNYPCFHTA